MEKSKKQSKDGELIQEFTYRMNSLFESALRESRRISGLLTTEDIRVKEILQVHSKKISNIQGKISNILEIFTYEKDEKEFEKDSIDINKEISVILAHIEKKSPGKRDRTGNQSCSRTASDQCQQKAISKMVVLVYHQIVSYCSRDTYVG